MKNEDINGLARFGAGGPPGGGWAAPAEHMGAASGMPPPLCFKHLEMNQQPVPAQPTDSHHCRYTRLRLSQTTTRREEREWKKREREMPEGWTCTTTSAHTYWQNSYIHLSHANCTCTQTITDANAHKSWSFCQLCQCYTECQNMCYEIQNDMMTQGKQKS